MNTRDDETIKLAQAAIAYTHDKLTYGSVNKASDERNPELIENYSRLSKLRNEKKSLLQRLVYTATFSPNINRNSRLTRTFLKAKLYEKYKVGNCEEHVIVALAYLKKHGVDDVEYCAMKDGDHQFLLLNGNIICDPWADKVYHVKDFEKEREAAKNFRYSYLVYEERPDMMSYMFGVPYVKKHTSLTQPPAIVDGQFVRSGVQDLTIDYSEYESIMGKLGIRSCLCL